MAQLYCHLSSHALVLSSHDYIVTRHLVLCPSSSPLTHIITTFSMLKVQDTISRLETWGVSLSSELDMSILLCSLVAVLRPYSRVYHPACTKHFSSLIMCNSPCHLLPVTEPICSCSSRIHSNADLDLFAPGISDPWEGCYAPSMLVLIYLVIWGLLESSISYLPSESHDSLCK